MSKKTHIVITATTLFLATVMISSCGSSSSGGSASNDSDGDGVIDSLDAFPNDPAETVDTDADGIGNNADLDDDADGVNDDIDQFPLDTDNDGLDNSEDDDDDEDGVNDADDAFPLDSSESMDSDGDGIGDNSDPDPTGASTITTGTNPNSVCITPPSAPGAFAGMFTGTLNANYNMGNVMGCSGVGTGNGYSIIFVVPDPGDTAGGNATFTFNIEGGGAIPTVVENAAASATISLDDQSATRGGIFMSDNCSINITGVAPLGGQAGGELYFVDGNITCDPLTVFLASNEDQPPIEFANPLVFRGGVAFAGF